MASTTPRPPVWAQRARVSPRAPPDTTGRWIIKRQPSTSRWVSPGQDLALLGACWWSRVAGGLYWRPWHSVLASMLCVWASHLYEGERQPYQKGDAHGLVMWPAVCGATWAEVSWVCPHCLPFLTLSSQRRPKRPVPFSEAPQESQGGLLLYILTTIVGVFGPSVGNSEIFVFFLFNRQLLSCLLFHAFVKIILFYESNTCSLQ